MADNIKLNIKPKDVESADDKVIESKEDTVKDNPNGYVNPFLVRACYKGFFNIDTGIITDMSVTKGAGEPV